MATSRPPPSQRLNPLATAKGQKLLCELTGKPASIVVNYFGVPYYYSDRTTLELDWNGIKQKIAQLLVPLRQPPSVIPSVEERERQEANVRKSKLALIDLCRMEATKFLVHGDFELSIPGAVQALRYSLDVYGAGKIELVPCYLLLAEANLGLGRHKQAEEYLSLANWSILKNPDCSNRTKSQLYRNFGKLYASQVSSPRGSAALGAASAPHGGGAAPPTSVRPRGRHSHARGPWHNTGRSSRSDSTRRARAHGYVRHMWRVADWRCDGWCLQGKHDEALRQLANDVYFSSLQVGPEHIETAGGYYYIATVFYLQRRIDCALAMCDKVVDIWLKHVSGLLSLKSASPEDSEPLGESQLMDGLQTLTKIVALREESMGPDHITTGEALYTVSLVYLYAKDNQRALQLMEKAYNIYYWELGPESKRTQELAESIRLAGGVPQAPTGERPQRALPQDVPEEDVGGDASFDQGPEAAADVSQESAAPPAPEEAGAEAEAPAPEGEAAAAETAPPEGQDSAPASAEEAAAAPAPEAAAPAAEGEPAAADAEAPAQPPPQEGEAAAAEGGEAAAAGDSAEGAAPAEPAAEGEAPAEPAAEGEAPAEPAAEGEAPAEPPAEGDAPAEPAAEGEAPAEPAAEGEAPAEPAAEGEAAAE